MEGDPRALCPLRSTHMRLYRGLKNAYDPARVSMGTDFTDCPWTALRYAGTRRGVLIVLDPPDTARLSEELWFDSKAARWMVWGAFDRWITAMIPAKEGRAVVRVRGLRAASDEMKTSVLRHAIERALASEPRAVLSTSPYAWGAGP